MPRLDFVSKKGKTYICILVGGLEHFLFFHILGIVTPTDFYIFQRLRHTTNQYYYVKYVKYVYYLLFTILGGI